MTYSIKGLNFVMTCEACPEQYDVFKEDKQVAYVRLRFGGLRVDYPECGGETIYKFNFKAGYKGDFEDYTERNFYLKAIADRINEKMLQVQDENELNEYGEYD